MKINGNTQVDLSLTNIDYNLNVGTSNVSGVTKKKNNKNENGIELESNIGPIDLKLALLTDELTVPTIDDINFNLVANYGIDDNINVGLKYEGDCKLEKYQVLSGLVDGKVEVSKINLNLYNENIIYGHKNENDVKVNLFGNKLNPSIGFADNKIKIGYMHDQLEEIDEYGNQDDKSSNKISLDLDIEL